jgi:hypothetical protein
MELLMATNSKNAHTPVLPTDEQYTQSRAYSPHRSRPTMFSRPSTCPTRLPEKELQSSFTFAQKVDTKSPVLLHIMGLASTTGHAMDWIYCTSAVLFLRLTPWLSPRVSRLSPECLLFRHSRRAFKAQMR